MQSLTPAGPTALAAGDRVATVRGVQLLDGRTVDVSFADGLVSTVGEATGPAETPGLVVDGSGWLMIPALGDPHTHLDKALTIDRTTPPYPRLDKALTVDRGAIRLNSLPEAVAQWQAMLPAIDGPDVRDRATRALGQYVAAGVTVIRSHVDLPPGEDPLRGLRAVLRLRDELAGRIILQVVPLVSPMTPLATVEAAVREGVDVLGGVPHLAEDPRAETTRLLDVAERAGLPVDLHTDERLDLDGLDLTDLAEQVLARGLEQRVTASHCVRLSLLDPHRLRETLDLVAKAGIAVVVNPQTNLYLQGREVPQAVPRGIAPVRAMLDAGITVAAGGDNLRDPFNAVGRGDPLEIASLLVSAGHVSPGEALDAVTTGVRLAMGLPPAGPEPGAVADLLLVPAQSLTSLVAGPGDARVVLGRGVVLARTRVERSVRLVTKEPQEAL